MPYGCYFCISFLGREEVSFCAANGSIPMISRIITASFCLFIDGEKDLGLIRYNVGFFDFIGMFFTI